MITGFHHTSFTVSNVDEAERFLSTCSGSSGVAAGRSNSSNYTALWRIPTLS